MSKRIVFIEGKRVYLRPLEKSDVPTLTRWINDPEVTQFLIRRWPMTLFDEERWVTTPRDPLKEGVVLMIVVKGKTSNRDRPIGTMSLHDISFENGVATTGAAIGEKDCWGKGYGTEAKMVFLNWAFNNFPLRKIYSNVLSTNPRSRAYSEKCGYVLEATLPGHFRRNGALHDEWILAVYEETWRNLWEKTKKRFTK